VPLSYLRISALPQNWHFTPGWLTGLLAMSPILDHFYWTTPRMEVCDKLLAKSAWHAAQDIITESA